MSAAMFTKVNGSPFSVCSKTPYVKSWQLKDDGAEDRLLPF